MSDKAAIADELPNVFVRAEVLAQALPHMQRYDEKIVVIAGTYAPPAVHEPSTAAICGMPAADILAWLKKMRPK